MIFRQQFDTSFVGKAEAGHNISSYRHVNGNEIFIGVDDLVQMEVDQILPFSHLKLSISERGTEKFISMLSIFSLPVA